MIQDIRQQDWVQRLFARGCPEASAQALEELEASINTVSPELASYFWGRSSRSN